MSKLTPKQERFCLEYIKDGNASRAYREAYDAENMSDKVVNNKASLLLKHGEIGVRLEELRKETSKDTIMSVEDRKEWLTKLIYHQDTDNNRVFMGDRLKALDILNKMEAQYIVKTQTELSGDLNVTAKVIKLPSRKDG